jgi:hypothetical protein
VVHFLRGVLFALCYATHFRPNIWPKEHLPDLETAFKDLGQIIIETGMLLMKHCDRCAMCADKCGVKLLQVGDQVMIHGMIYLLSCWDRPLQSCCRYVSAINPSFEAGSLYRVLDQSRCHKVRFILRGLIDPLAHLDVVTHPGSSTTLFPPNGHPIRR